MAKTSGPVALKLGDEVLVKVQTNTAITDLLEQLDKACKGGRIQDADGFDVTAHYLQDLPEGEYVIQTTAGEHIDAAARVVVSSYACYSFCETTYNFFNAAFQFSSWLFGSCTSASCTTACWVLALRHLLLHHCTGACGIENHVHAGNMILLYQRHLVSATCNFALKRSFVM